MIIYIYIYIYIDVNDIEKWGYKRIFNIYGDIHDMVIWAI